MDKNALFDISYGIYVVCSSYNGKDSGQIVNSAIQVSSDPATIAISVSKNNYTHSLIEKSKKFTLSTISQKANMRFVGNFGFKSGKDINKFEDIHFTRTSDKIPVVTEYATSIFEAEVIAALDSFTHTIFLGKITDSMVLNSDEPMTYTYYRRELRGKTAPNAPTYKEPTEGYYTCRICGYQYMKDPAEFEALPIGWTCPVCGATKNLFHIYEGKDS